MYRVATNEGLRRNGHPAGERSEDYQAVVDLGSAVRILTASPRIA